MNTKRFFLIAIMVSGLAAAAFLAYADRDEGLVPADGLFLPAGDPAAGQAAFARLKCSACHWVRNNVDLTAPVAEKTGPMLGPKQAGYTPGWIANSIISPSHTIAAGSSGQTENGELSRMGDFREAMSVRELIDIVAYIGSLDDTGVDLPEDLEMEEV